MILCIDCGNTSIKFGLYDGEKLAKKFKIKTIKDKTSDEYLNSLKSFFDGKENVEGAIISSVVPILTTILEHCLEKLFGIKPLILNKNLKTKIAIKTDNPLEFGSDMLAGAVAAKKKYGYPLVVADLGTATKLYVIDKTGSIIGCAIGCGMEVELQSLANKASQLMEVPLETPQKIIGKNTRTSIQSGVIFGQAFMVSEFARRMEKELGYELTRVLTGGFSPYIKEQIVCFNYEENLTLDGLLEIYNINR